MAEKFKKTSIRAGAGVFLFLILSALDQYTKAFAARVFLNRNFAFSIPLPVWLMYAIYAAAIIAIIIYCLGHYRFFDGWRQAAWLLILTGAILNVGERLALGYVRDIIYIYFWKWVGIYNFADFYILLGILLLLISPTFTKRKSLP